MTKVRVAIAAIATLAALAVTVAPATAREVDTALSPQAASDSARQAVRYHSPGATQIGTNCNRSTFSTFVCGVTWVGAKAARRSGSVRVRSVKKDGVPYIKFALTEKH